MFKNMNTERASYFTERSYTTSEAENKKDIFEYWKKIFKCLIVCCTDSVQLVFGSADKRVGRRKIKC